MMRVFHPEFRDERLDSNYPFGDAATLTSDEGKVLDKSTFLDASICAIGVSGPVYLSSIVISSNMAYFYLSNDEGDVIAQGEINVLSPSPVIALIDTYERPAGVLVGSATSLAVFQTWDFGTYNFSTEAAEFTPSTVLPVPNVGVRGVVTEDGSLFTDDIWLVGKDGVLLRQDSGSIRIDIVGDPYFRRRLCEDQESYEEKRFVKTINNIPPDQYGRFIFTVASHDVPDCVVRIFEKDGGMYINLFGKKAAE